MNGDFSRLTFDPKQHFSQVLHLQGRVLCEADLNEQGRIYHHFLRALIVDLVGPRWRAGEGFTIKLIPATNDDFEISEGHYYIDGILCENEVPCTYKKQPMWPVPEYEDEIKLSDGVAIYIECWERHVSHLEVPRLREVALGGPDTASRAQITWQVRVVPTGWAEDFVNRVISALRTRKPVGEPAIAMLNADIQSAGQALEKFTAADGINCENAQKLLDVLDLAIPQMRAVAKKTANEVDPCTIAADAAYRGLENQLYRVEIHAGGIVGDKKSPPTFKWSRENGSVVFRIMSMASEAGGGDSQDSTLTIELETLGRDRRSGLCQGDWVELTSREFELAQRAEPLARVYDIDPTRRTVVLKVKKGFEGKFTECTILRRWDQKDDVRDDGTLLVTEASGMDGWIAIERGIKVQFQPGGNYKTGDYWLIPARVATGDIEWPREGDYSVPVKPHGIERHRAVLAIVGPSPAHRCGCSITPMCDLLGA